MVSVFVSHSSKDRELTEQVRDALSAAPDGGTAHTALVDFEILLDYDALIAGQLWPAQLHEWLARCHAGLILLTPHAVASPWVLKEATILSWRLAVDGDFSLFVVRFPGVTDDQIARAGFGPLELDRIQRINALDPAEIGRVVRVSLPAAAPRSEFDRLVGRLRDVLARVGVNTLADVAEKLAGQPVGVPRDDANRARFVEEIARQILCETLGGYAGVDELVDSLSVGPPREAVEQMFRIVAPYWVDLAAAGRLPPLTGRKARRAAAMNGARVGDFTSKMYVRRAHPLSRAHSVIPTAGGAPGDPADHFTREICAHVRREENRRDDDAAIVKDLAKRPARRYAVLSGPVDRVSLETLMDRFPTLTFILWTGEELDRDAALGDVEWLEPEVDLTKEEQQHQRWQEAERILREMAEP